MATVRFEGGVGLVSGGVFYAVECLFSLLLFLVPAPFLSCVLCGFLLAMEVFTLVIAVFLSLSFFPLHFPPVRSYRFYIFFPAFFFFFLIGSTLVLGLISAVDRG